MPTRPIGRVIRVFANPRSNHTKDTENDTWCHLT